MSETANTPVASNTEATNTNTSAGKDVSKGQIITAASLSSETISAFFNLPLYEACVNLKVDEASLKKRCRELGILRWPYRKRTNLVSEIHNHLENSSDVMDPKAAKMMIAKSMLKGAEEEKPYYFGSFPATPSAKPVLSTVSTKTVNPTENDASPSSGLFHSFQLSSKYSKRQKTRQQKYQQILRDALHPNGTPEPEEIDHQSVASPQKVVEQPVPSAPTPTQQQIYMMPTYVNPPPTPSYPQQVAASSMYSSPQTPHPMCYPQTNIYYSMPPPQPMMFPVQMLSPSYGYPQVMYPTAPMQYALPSTQQMVPSQQVKVLNAATMLPSFSAFVEGCGVEHFSALQKRSRSAFEEGLTQTELSQQEQPQVKKSRGITSIQDILNRK